MARQYRPTGYEARVQVSIEEDADVGVSLLEVEEEGQKFILANLFKNRYGAKKNITYKYLMDYRMNLRLQQKAV